MSSSNKNPYIAAINQAVADFDIQTQVKRISLQTLDSYMKGNRQAFEYIQQWNDKIKNFEFRLSEAENYYKKIEINVNSKVQITNELNTKLSQFSEQFWTNMKQNEFSLEQMRKNYLNLVRQTGNQNNQLKNLSKNLELTDQKIDKNHHKFDDEIMKLTEKQEQIRSLILQKDSDHTKETQKLLLKFSQTKAQMDTKTQNMSNLLKDLSLYKTEKVSITQQLNELYEEIEKRVLKTQFNEIRLYIDTNMSNQKKRADLQMQRLHRDITKQRQQRKQADTVIQEMIQKFKAETSQKFKQIHKIIQQNHRTLNIDIEKFKKETLEKFQIKDNQIQVCNQNIQQNSMNIARNQESCQQSQSSIKAIQQRISQCESNILSTNDLIGQIQKQSLERDNDLRKMKMDTQQMGNINQQVVIFGQKINLHDQSISKHQKQHQKLAKQVREIQNAVKQQKETNINRNQSVNLKINKGLLQINNKLTKQSTQLNDLIELRHKQSLEFSSNSLNTKLDSFKNQFDFLSRVSSQMKQFKQTFRTQIAQSQQINIDIKEKMDKIMAMFTKLKTDFYIKVQALSQDQNKTSGKTKQLFKYQQEVTKYLGELNQIVMISLVFQLFAALSDNTTADKNSIKIASILEGWIVEAEQKESKFKYRGQVSSRKMMLQLTIEYLVKMGDKLKGGILENGKQVYNRIVSGNQEIKNTRRRSNSRRRQSQLPKLYK